MNDISGYEEILRDWFAGQVLPSLISETQSFTTAANWAYEYADAMLNERALWANRKAAS